MYNDPAILQFNQEFRSWKFQSVSQSVSKNRSFLAFAIASLIFPTASFAADVNGFNSCNALLTAGIYNTSQSSNATDSESLRKSSFCSADYSLVSNKSSQQYSSGQSAQIEASYGLFSGGAGVHQVILVA
ncbi:MAG: hypothetical protein WCL34_10280 [Methylococcaceae bacterium]